MSEKSIDSHQRAGLFFVMSQPDCIAGLHDAFVHLHGERMVMSCDVGALSETRSPVQFASQQLCAKPYNST